MPNINTKNRILCLFEGGYDAYRKVKKEEYQNGLRRLRCIALQRL